MSYETHKKVHTPSSSKQRHTHTMAICNTNALVFVNWCVWCVCFSNVFEGKCVISSVIVHGNHDHDQFGSVVIRFRRLEVLSLELVCCNRHLRHLAALNCLHSFGKIWRSFEKLSLALLNYWTVKYFLGSKQDKRFELALVCVWSSLVLLKYLQ